MPDVRDMRAALERGSRIVVVAPPAPEQLGVWELLAPGTVIVCPDRTAASDWVAAAPPGRAVLAISSLPRAARLLKAGTPDLLAGSLADLRALVAGTHLKLHAAPVVVLAWPEALAAGEQAAELDELLAESADARRVILSWNPATLEALLERQAHRAPVFGTPPVDDAGRPAPPVGAARYAITTPERRLAALHQVVEVLDPATVVVWTPDERHAARLRDVLGPLAGAVSSAVPDQPASLVICARVPARDRFAALTRVGPVVVLAAPYQLPYLRSLAAPLEPVPLPGATHGARDRATELRERVAARLGRGDVDAELALLAPLFDRFDPAEVAAALLALRRDEAPATPAGTPAGDAPGWVRVFVSVGRRDRAAARDLVGALTREVGLSKEDIGRVDIRESHTLVEIANHASDMAITGLSRVAIRGKRVNARVDRPR